MTISGSVGPPSPDASMIRMAATIGEPKIAEIAANTPAAPITSSRVRGASFLACFTT